MKLRILPMILSVAGSSAILFGGWFVYQTVAMEKPLNQALTGSPGVVSSEAQINDKKVMYHLTLNSQAQLREIVHKLNEESASVIGGRELVLDVKSDSSPMLDEWWSRALFDVAQAMETSQYADIPAKLEQKAAQLSGLAVQSEMDDKNVYIRLTDGEHVKYVILPRSPAKMGVWPNE